MFLADWVGEEPEPGSIFVEQPALWAAEGTADSPWARLRRWMGHLMPAPAWGFGFATVLLVGLILAGFRVDRLDGGIAHPLWPDRARRADRPGRGPGDESPSESGYTGNPAGSPTSLDGTIGGAARCPPPDPM